MTMSKKEKRVESKKRKVAAFLKLVEDENTEKSPNATSEKKRKLHVDDKDGCSVNVIDSEQDRMEQERDRINHERLRILAELKEKRKLAMERPKIFLTLDNLDDDDGERLPLFTLDLQHLLLFGLQGNSTSYKPRWCKLLRCTKVTGVVVVVLDSVGQMEYDAFKSTFSELNTLFEMSVALISPSQYGSTVDEELFHVPFSVSQIKDMGMQNEAAREISETSRPEFKYYLSQTRTVYSNLPDGDSFPRIHLLLSSSQMSSYKYPLPLKEKEEDHKGFVFTADRYSEVTSQSPMFAVDCEMCITSAKVSELTWVSVVNEDLEVIYESLVKPYNRIDNYLTRFSGITKELLASVSTRLEEVQAHIRKILPPDAILCGQSLNSDLTALKMFHPYVIDTSIIYNLSGQNNAKSSLRKLANIFLGKLIQDETTGHNPCEDAIATMELVKLKLRKGIGYGDVRMGAIMYPGLRARKYPKTSVTKVNTSADCDNGAEKADTVPKETDAQEPTGPSVAESGRATVKPNSAQNLAVGVQEQVERRKHFFGFKDNNSQNSFFSKLQMAGKKATVVDEESIVEKYRGVSDCLTCVSTTSDKESKSEGKQAASRTDFLWTQLHGYRKLIESSDECSWEEKTACLKKMDRRLSSIFQAAPQGSICMVLLTGRTTENLTNNAMTFVKVKV